MSAPVIILEEAEEEVKAAEEWYESQREGLGVEFRLEIDAAMELLAAHPAAAHPVRGVSHEFGARQVFVKRFPYSVVFLNQRQALWVLAFAHQRRRPGYWKNRI